MSNTLRDIIRRNRNGEIVSIPSVCTAHPEALLAALMLARELDWPVLIEATSNQVNQHGGYTGMRPEGFRALVAGLCETAQVPPGLVTFGGDHLGPQAWRGLSAGTAMAEAEVLVKGYVRAGFRKIHLDCSEGCAGEPEQVGDDIAAARAAQLAAVCEATAGSDRDSLLYVIGTEVPPPGGGRGADHAIVPTSLKAARATLDAHRKAFHQAGLDEAFERVVGLVVQPGVDFEPDHVHHLPAGGVLGLRRVLDAKDGLCLEAHSTDYQHAQAYRQLAAAGFAIQKVGPALTHAYRQAVYALADLESDVTGRRGEPDIAVTMETLMLDNPRWWSGHYHGSPAAQCLLRHSSLSDRIRYYWPQPAAVQALDALLARLGDISCSKDDLARHFSAGIVERSSTIARAYGLPRSRALILASVQEALRPYFLVPPVAS